MNLTKPQIAQESYTSDYYLRASDGAEIFNATKGRVLPKRQQTAVSLTTLTPNMRVLDVGCGRGEVLIHCAGLGLYAYGIDYSSAAVAITYEAIHANDNTTLCSKISIIQSDARTLPYSGESMDRIFMLDIVEHLAPRELHSALVEAHRVLRPNGLLIVHTMPNTWYYNYGYPIYRLFQRLRKSKLPANPRDRWNYSEVHINEQNVLTLHSALLKANYGARVWHKNVGDFNREKNDKVRLMMKVLSEWPVVKWIFCNDLFAVASKR